MAGNLTKHFGYIDALPMIRYCTFLFFLSVRQYSARLFCRKKIYNLKWVVWMTNCFLLYRADRHRALQCAIQRLIGPRIDWSEIFFSFGPRHQALGNRQYGNGHPTLDNWPHALSKGLIHLIIGLMHQAMCLLRQIIGLMHQPRASYVR